MTPDDVISFWFGDGGSERVKAWFKKDDVFDARIRDRFGAAIADARDGRLDGWLDGRPEDAARGALALVVLCDQMSRNAFRDTPDAFAADEKARAVLGRARTAGWDELLAPLERYILYMPLMHAESREVQEDSVATFKALADAGADLPIADLLRSAHDYAERHARIVERFGRYPHRNAILGRESTEQEREFLAQPGSSF